MNLSNCKKYLCAAIFGLMCAVSVAHAVTAAEFEAMEQRRKAIVDEIKHCQRKIAQADKKLIGAEATGAEEYIKKWQAELEAWNGRLEFAKEELDLLESDIAGAASQFKKDIDAEQGVVAIDDGLVHVGDSLEIVVTEDESFNGMYQVRRGGYVIMPQIGRIMVAGKDQAAAEAAIRESLGKDLIRDATVLVELPERKAAVVEDKARGHVYLIGEWPTYTGTSSGIRGNPGFKVPGLQILPKEDPSVVKMILQYGHAPFADLEHVKVLRLIDGKPLVEEVNVKAVLSGNELASDLQLQHEDIIIIPRLGNTNRVYITGEVGKPDTILPLPHDEELTCYTAIIRSGGQGDFANLRKVFVLRDLGSGTKTRIEVDLKAVKRGEVPDLVLQANDVIVVPEKFFSF